MKGEDILRGLNYTEESLVEEALQKPSRNSQLKKWMMAAACMLLAAIGITAVLRIHRPELEAGLDPNTIRENYLIGDGLIFTEALFLTGRLFGQVFVYYFAFTAGDVQCFFVRVFAGSDNPNVYLSFGSGKLTGGDRVLTFLAVKVLLHSVEIPLTIFSTGDHIPYLTDLVIVNVLVILKKNECFSSQYEVAFDENLNFVILIFPLFGIQPCAVHSLAPPEKIFIYIITFQCYIE